MPGLFVVTCMIPLQMTSGDLIADRRAAYAEALFPDDPQAAADLLRQTLDLVPLWVAGWFRLGEMLGPLDAEAAATAFARALDLDPEDRLGAGLMCDTLRARSLADTMPSAFVETLFDQYAAGFDTALVARLDYRAPQLLRAGLRGRFDRVLDLGCGTGLMGAELRGMAGYLEGWDISGEMLREASAKGIYDRLEKRDLSALSGQSVIAFMGASDIIPGLKDAVPAFKSYKEIADQIGQSRMIFGQRVDAVIGDGMIFAEYNRQLRDQAGGLMFDPNQDVTFQATFAPSDYGMYFRSEALTADFNRCHAEAVADGSLAAINRAWADRYRDTLGDQYLGH